MPFGGLRAGQFVGDVVTQPETPPSWRRRRGSRLGVSNGVAMFRKVRDLMVDYLLAPPDSDAFPARPS